jgi:hypothetical protein
MSQYQQFQSPGILSYNEWFEWLYRQSDSAGRAILLPVEPRMSEVCERCYGAGIFRAGTTICTNCANFQPNPIDGLCVISYSFHDGLESLIATAKRSYYGDNSWQFSPIAALFYNWISMHLRCISNAFNSKFVLARVPSATDKTDHLGHIWDRIAELDTHFPIDFNLVNRVIGPGKPSRGEMNPAYYRVSDSVRNKSILLVDDIWTSGSQMTSVASALKIAGARRIVGLTLGRTLNETNFGNNVAVSELVGKRVWTNNECRFCVTS